ncbi:MAG: DNA primase small subunit [Candidatus Nitrosocaldaceae archaeon]|nr:MAG: DNA primase small subunit [Candidatus Nitrosocaldaceae archaeon]
MKEDSLELVRKAFRRYYFYKFDAEIRDISRREFGYATFDNKIIRHLSFKSIDELRALLIREIPADAYLSNAYYTNPTAEMDLKGWLYADLIFDIDIKDIPLKCTDNHKISICSNCKRIERSQICSNCNSNIKVVNIPCKNCIDVGKEQVRRLLDIINDLGSFDIKIYFSGNNGFHVHIYDEELSSIDSDARREVLDYVTGRGIIPDIFGIRKDKNEPFIIKRVINAKKGWKGRIIKYMLSQKDENSLFRSLIRKQYQRFSKELEDIVKMFSAYSVDPVVTIDTHRIFRLENSLSSKSGLAKIIVDDIDDFNPFNDASLIDDELASVYVYNAPEFILKDNIFGPYDNTKVELPLYAAVYLICKGLAEAIN